MAKANRIGIYDAFACVGASCVESCCKSFAIIVEDETWAKYKQERGLLGLRLRFFTRGGDTRLLNPYGTGCPFYTRDGLCELQQKKGEDFLPVSCRLYPRKRRNLGVYAEEYLELSCVEAARLFLTARDAPAYVATTREADYGRRGSNDDPAFLDALLQTRDALAQLVYGEKEIATAFQKALDLAALWQLQSAKGEALSMPQDQANEAQGKTRAKTFLLPIDMLNEWMNGCVYADDLKRRLPFLFRAFRLYAKRFDKLRAAQGQLRLDELFQGFCSGAYYNDEKYRRYFVYALYREYLETYEDYSFVRHVREALTHVNMIALLDALWADEYGSLPVKTQARLIAVYEKRVLHNTDVMRRMYKQWQETGGWE